MELKSYQKETLQDLADFLHTVEQEKDIFKAYERYLSERKELPARPPYKNEIKGVPHVCFKVPTGGGKTFIAAASIRTIFSFLPDTNVSLYVIMFTLLWCLLPVQPDRARQEWVRAEV